MRRWLLDAPTSLELARLLPSEDDVRSVADELLHGIADVQVAALARRQGRIVVTPDKGFIRSMSPGHPGLVLLRPRRNGLAPQLAVFDAALQQLPDDMQGLVVVSDARGVRIARAPSA